MERLAFGTSTLDSVLAVHPKNRSTAVVALELEPDFKPMAVGLFDTGQKTMPLEWKDAADVVARLGEKFMKRVIENSGRGSFVRFGLTGSGQFPNYQVEIEGRPRALYSGRSHKEWTGDVDAFEPHNISQEFAFEALYAEFVRQYRAPLKPKPPSGR